MKKTHSIASRALAPTLGAALLLAAAIPLGLPAQTINVEFNTTDGTLAPYAGTAAAPDTNTIWNALAVGPEAGSPLVETVTSDALITSDGVPTGVTVALGNFKTYEANENLAGLAPELMGAFVYQPNIGPGGPDGTFAINYLDPAFTYDVYLYAQNGGYGSAISVFTIGGVSKTVANAGNAVTTFTEGVNYVVFARLVPDEWGTIAGTFNSGKAADNAAFTGLQVVEHGFMDPPFIATQPASQRVVEGSTVTFTVSALGTDPISFEWSKDGAVLAEQTTETLTLLEVTASDSGTYRVRATNDFGFVDSAPATLTVLPPPVQTINVDFNTSNGTLDTYVGTAAAPNGDTTWNGLVVGPEGGSLVAGVTSDALVTSAGAPTPVTVALGNFKTYEANESLASLAPELMSDFVYQRTLGPGGPDATFAIHNLNPLVTYDLYLYAQNGGYGNTATIFTIGGVSKTVANAGNGMTALTEGVHYVLFTELVPDGWGTISGTFNDVALANNAAFTGLQLVQYHPDPTDAAPNVAVQADSQTAVAGHNVTFTVSATGTPPLSFQWSKDGSPLAGQTTATLTLSEVTLDDQGSYRVRVSNDFGFADSDPATLTLVDIPPGFTKQPITQIVVEGKTVIFTASLTGSAPLTYQWSKDGSALAGQNTATLTLLDVTASNDGIYRLHVTNEFGFAESDPATLTVIPAPEHATINVDFKTSDGSRPTYSGTAAARDNGSTWNRFVVGPEAGSPVIDSLTSEPLVTSFDLPSTVTVTLGNFKAYEADERVAALAPDLMADYVYQPILGMGGPDGTFSINNLDPALTYDVYLLAQNGGYAGTTTIFTIGGVPKIVANTGNGVVTFIEGVNYVLFAGVAPDSSGTISGTFNDAVPNDNAAFSGLQIAEHGFSDPPLITTHPASRKVVEGSTVTFTVSATGTDPLYYDWTKDETMLGEQTTATLTLYDVTADDSGVYRVRVSNAFGFADSEPVTLTVVPPPVQTINVDFNTTDGTQAAYAGTAAALDNGTTWNTLAVGAEAGSLLIESVTSDALVTSAGEGTPVTVALGHFKTYEANERPAALAPDLLTAFVYQETIGPGGPDSTFAINNLDPLMTYDVYLYAQNGGYAGTISIFTIGGVSKSVANAGNSVTAFTEGVNYAVFAGLSPDSSGTIAGTFNSGKPADNAAFTGLQIVLAGSAPPKLSITRTAPDTLSISWAPVGSSHRLESAPTVAGPWTTISTVSPKTVTITDAPALFFRVQQ